jgi:(E)-4-hydroxy-3-methylbut-2-enyl-diphosphate synthase
MNADAIKMLQGRYCNSLTEYSRFVTREVAIGDVPMGGNNPIRIQSMTTTDTMDTVGTVEQSIRMVDAGCEYVRITAPSIKEANNLAEIKKQLRLRGYNVPLVADIHFTPNAAEVAARIVEKVRVNPGNYADKKKFDTLDYTDLEYRGELERIFQKFTPLVKICKEYGTAMRIGTNHGSLSDRIMSRYGDTPQGMVESAMEFIRMCETLGYYSLVVSMKSSNPQVMVQAYRLLVQTMVAEGMNYPLHLGVTEAGDGEDGRIKSAVGIGTLLEDGLGDTVRVSLTEEPEAEAPVAIALVKRYTMRNEVAGAKSEENINTSHLDPQNPHHSPYEYKKRETYEANAFIGGHMVPRVVVDLSRANLKDPAVLSDAGYLYSPLLDKYNMAEQSVDFVYLGDSLPSFELPGNLKQLYNYSTWQRLTNKTLCHPVFTLDEYVAADNRTSALNLVRVKNADLDSEAFGLIPLDKTLVFVLETDEITAWQISAPFS